MDNKITIMYDVTILANYSNNDEGRSGTFMVAYNIFINLLKK